LRTNTPRLYNSISRHQQQQQKQVQCRVRPLTSSITQGSPTLRTNMPRLQAMKAGARNIGKEMV
jgi:hypothetical protein